MQQSQNPDTDLVVAIETERDKRGLTNEELAAKLGMDGALWSRIRNHIQPPTRALYEGVAKAFPHLHLLLVHYMAERAEKNEGAS